MHGKVDVELAVTEEVEVEVNTRNGSRIRSRGITHSRSIFKLGSIRESKSRSLRKRTSRIRRRSRR